MNHDSTPFGEWMWTFEWVPLDEIHSDPAGQRLLDRARAARIAREFDPDKFHEPRISQRTEGGYFVIDGQHRIEALRIWGMSGDTKVPCMVSQSLTIEAEANVSVGVNNFKAWRAIDKFRLRVRQGDPIAIAVTAIVEEKGFKIAPSSMDGSIAAVQALEAIYLGTRFHRKEPQPDALRVTLDVVSGAWGFTSEAVERAIIQGIGQVILRDLTSLDLASLIRKLAKYPGGPDALQGAALGLKAFRPGSLVNCVSEICVDLYNKGRRIGKVPPWRREHQVTA